MIGALRSESENRNARKKYLMRTNRRANEC